MISKNSDLVAYSGQNAFSSAGEAGKKVRLNKSLCDEKIGFGGKPVDYARAPEGRVPIRTFDFSSRQSWTTMRQLSMILLPSFAASSAVEVGR